MADWYFQDRPKLSPKQTALLKRLAVGLHGEDLDEMNQILAVSLPEGAPAAPRHLATKISSEGVNLDKQAFNAS